MDKVPPLLCPRQVQFLIRCYRYYYRFEYSRDYSDINLVITEDYRIYDLNIMNYVDIGNQLFIQVVQCGEWYYALSIDGDLYYYNGRRLKPRLSRIVDWISPIGYSGILISKNGILLAKMSGCDRNRFACIEGDPIEGEFINYNDLIVKTDQGYWLLDLDNRMRVSSIKLNIILPLQPIDDWIIDMIVSRACIYILTSLGRVYQFYYDEGVLYDINNSELESIHNNDPFVKLCIDHSDVLIITQSGLLIGDIKGNHPNIRYGHELSKRLFMIKSARSKIG